jgi:hypothetical protein
VEVTATAEAEGEAHGESGKRTECATLSEVMAAEGMSSDGEDFDSSIHIELTTSLLTMMIMVTQLILMVMMMTQLMMMMMIMMIQDYDIPPPQFH